MGQAENIVVAERHYAQACQQPPTVIVGAGPVGQRLVTELRRHDAEHEIVMFGDEPWAPYDRVRLSSWLAGEAPGTEAIHEDAHMRVYLGMSISRIDRSRREVIDGNGIACPYEKLVLATGSSARIPSVPGAGLPGVFTFRNLSDAQSLMARSVRSRHMVVIGGGLLGLETARALYRFNTRITVIEHATRLMFQQLDEDCADLLQQHVRALGIEVLTNVRVLHIRGGASMEGVLLADGRFIECDTVVMAAGITPNIQLAQECGLHTGRGILVDDHMQTSDADIFAVGECAEHRQTVYGLVAPGFEQAAVAAHALTGHNAEYTGSMTATRLKVVGYPVMSVGTVETEWPRRTLVYRGQHAGVLRKVFLDGNRLDAAMAVGTWDEFSRVQEGVRTRRRIRPWRALRFRLTGTLWSAEGEGGVAGWPAGATVCNCKGVSRGALTRAVDQGCADIDCLASCTGAATVCGSCKPLLGQLLGAVEVAPVMAARTLTVAALVVTVATLLWLLPVSLPYADTVQDSLRVDALWRSGLFKQISGFTLLGLSLLLALVSVRKRVRRLYWGVFDGWRVLHVLAGVLTVAVLVAHTGFRLGDNLNFYLMCVFAGLLLAGAAASAAVGLQHVLPVVLARRTRALSIWGHVLLLWPLPALLGFHILKSYWY
jgi:nitrite reductase (NADH) large subunit